jgi:phosphoadenylyl-sulfate reductase (thioredoxin)
MSTGARTFESSQHDGDTLARDARALEGRSPREILAWAAVHYPRITFATGFGPEGCVLLDLIGRHAIPIDLFTLDTGLLFQETHDLWRRLEERYGFTIRAVRPGLTAHDRSLLPRNLWESAPDRCCDLRKVQPLREALSGFEAWVSAVRRDQTADRADAQVLEHDRRFGLVKVNPLVTWTSEQVWDYLRVHDVPVNVLHARGYPSIGCLPCTTPVAAGEDPRAGRWRGLAKKECGLHSRPGRPAHGAPVPAPSIQENRNA